MRKLVLTTAATVFTFLLFTSVVLAQDVQVTPQYYRIKDFRFASGETIPELVVEYGTLGTKSTETSGNVTNAIIWCHGWSGNYASIRDVQAIVGPGKALDPTKHFIIFPTAIGSPGSSAASTSKLGPKFPQYTISDMVRAQRSLVTEHLGIRHVKAVAGASMGGYQALQWAVDYPDLMDVVIPIATSFDSKGRVFATCELMNHLIRRDPAYQAGNYTEQPKLGLEDGFTSRFLWVFSSSFYKDRFPTNQALWDAMRAAGQAGTKSDANDAIWRNNAMSAYSTKELLGNIKARTLVIGINQDNIYPLDTDVIPLSKMIKGAKAFFYDSMFGHAGCAMDLGKAEAEIRAFLQ